MSEVKPKYEVEKMTIGRLRRTTLGVEPHADAERRDVGQDRRRVLRRRRSFPFRLLDQSRPERLSDAEDDGLPRPVRCGRPRSVGRQQYTDSFTDWRSHVYLSNPPDKIHTHTHTQQRTGTFRDDNTFSKRVVKVLRSTITSTTNPLAFVQSGD